MTDALRPVSLPPGRPKPIIHEASPENLEYPTASITGWMTPVSRFFRRNHFAYPTVDLADWRLTVDGEVAAGRTFRLADLSALPQTSAWITLVCSGNKRSLFEPPAEGTPWRSGAAGNAEWGGVLLRDLLRLTGPRPEALEVLFTGADHGTFKETGQEVAFARSLPLAATMDGGALLAVTMNGEPLPPEHGGPCRLVVPRWYGMASVKWLTRIGLLSRPFRGPFQTRDYLYLPAPGAYDRATPVTLKKVDSVVTHPAPDQRFKPGRVTLRGVAWGGPSPLVAVEVSLDGGATWAEAELAGPGAPDAWRLWQFVTPSLPPGRHRAMVRATNADGDVQPAAAPWNAKGYGNNAMPRVRFVVALLSSRPSSHSCGLPHPL